MTSNSDVLAFGIPGAAASANLGRSKVYELIRSGQLRARKAGRRTVILADDLRSCLESLPAFQDEKVELAANIKRSRRPSSSKAEGEPA